MTKIKISLISLLWMALLAISDTPYLLPTLFAVVLHELGHIFCAKILKIQIRKFNLSLLGARLEIAGEISYQDELLLALGGPLFGALGFAFSLFPALKFGFPALLHFAIISLVLALFNLLPLETLDGGRILKCLFCLAFGLDTARKMMKIASFFTLFLMWLFSVYIMLKIASGVQTFVFCAFFFAKCFIFDRKNGDFASF